ncbi:MAG: Enolase [Candidatus Pacebacteria bacterium GW2011_GWB1_47_8]|nr:MAG: Enolase [Candidatus Pacebacteria bacterium GW2011_GWA1_46_10]KKU84257.1 MAG: Enolase [Candidatus Pacebacteria bacterium GW2011_GWB1_47_8]HCR81477.1 phosphopyruvate hydratase [Candidatus Paceibacterota bacterium]
MKITQLIARQILDSRGYPTLEAELTLSNETAGRAAIPGGTSAGRHEAVELRDEGEAYFGQAVTKAVNNVKTTLAQALIGKEFDQTTLDQTLIELDGTDNKGRLGANAILSVSLAFAWAASRAESKPLYHYIGDLYGNAKFVLPRPMFNIMNGGKHANWATDIQEYMVIPIKAATWAEKQRVGVEIYHALYKLLKTKKYSTNVGYEGGFAPQLESNEEALELMIQAITTAGYAVATEVAIGLDPAASEFYNSETKRYQLKRDQKTLTSEQMVRWTVDLTQKYPLISLEDMLAEDDWAGWTSLTEQLGGTTQIVGDDLLTTNTKLIKQAITQKACNSLLVKLNQIGTLTETLQAMKLAQNAGWTNVVSHRSGETEDVTIAHLAVGTGCGQIKTGAPSRSERTAKYNELTRIAEKLEPTV